MTDRSRAPMTVTAARIGRTELGEATIALEDDVLTIAVRDTPGERPLRIEFATIDAVLTAGGEVTLSLRGNTRLTLACASPADLHAAILDGCRTVPELTSALRTFGSRRGSRSKRPSAGDEQRRFFAPMLRARREAGEALAPSATIAAFDADALMESTHRALRGFAEQRHAVPGAPRRALEAELLDAGEALDASFDRLRDAASLAARASHELTTWRAWASALRATFEAADRVWLLVDAILDAAPAPADPQYSKKTQKKTMKRP